MADCDTGAEALRVLLVGFKDAEAERTVRELCARGLDARTVTEPAEAMRAARSGGADVVCLQIPLAGADPIGMCAMLKEGPAPPGVLLLDACGQAQSVIDALPEDLRPDGVVPPPLDAVRLLVAIGPMLGRAAVASGGPAGPTIGELLVDLKEKRETGVLEVRAEGVRTDLHVHRGDPVLAEGGTIRETLGRLLVRHGTLREEDYVRVIQRMTESLVEHEPLRMGEALVELGLLSPVDVYQALVNQVHEKVVACFQWERPALEFRPVETMPQQVTSFRCAPTEALVLRGIRTHYDAGRVAKVLEPYAARYPVPKDEIARIAERWQLSPAEQRLLRSATGERTIAQLARPPDLDALHAGQILAALVVGRALALHARPRPPRAPAAEAAPVPTQGSVDRPARAGSGAAGPARPAPPVRAPQAPPPRIDAAAPPPPPAAAPADRARSEAATVVRVEPAGARSGIRPADALRRLRNTLARGKQAPETVRTKQQADLTAEQSFQRGKELLRRAQPGGALKELERALALRPDELEYQLYASWAQSLTVTDANARAVARVRVRQISLQLTRQSKGHPKAHTILGQLLLEEGEVEAAEKHFRIAVQTDPNEIDAERGLRLLTLRKSR